MNMVSSDRANAQANLSLLKGAHANFVCFVSLSLYIMIRFSLNLFSGQTEADQENTDLLPVL